MSQHIGDHFPDPNPQKEFFPYSEAFQAQDQKNPGTNGGDAGAATYNDRILNTVVQSASWAGLSSNQITLQPGTYDIYFDAPARGTGVYFNQLYNVTDTEILFTGPSGSLHSTYLDSGGAAGYYRWTIASAKTIKLRTRTTTARATDGLGIAASQGPEIYANVLIFKVAD